jgi:hypothetical protein
MIYIGKKTLDLHKHTRISNSMRNQKLSQPWTQSMYAQLHRKNRSKDIVDEVVKSYSNTFPCVGISGLLLSLAQICFLKLVQHHNQFKRKKAYLGNSIRNELLGMYASYC